MCFTIYYDFLSTKSFNSTMIYVLRKEKQRKYALHILIKSFNLQLYSFTLYILITARWKNIKNACLTHCTEILTACYGDLLLEDFLYLHDWLMTWGSSLHGWGGVHGVLLWWLCWLLQYYGRVILDISIKCASSWKKIEAMKNM